MGQIRGFDRHWLTGGFLALFVSLNMASAVRSQDQIAAAELPPGPATIPTLPSEGPTGVDLPPGPATLPRPAPETPAGQTITAGQQATYFNSPDVGRLLTESDASLGIQNQFRSAIISDPRIRGYHVGQITSYGDGGYFVPARVDLDTIVSKLDPTAVRDIIVIKGPYSVRYGPGFAFLDIETFDSPRARQGNTYEFHERTVAGYFTNGRGWHGLQMFEFGAADWGVRATYDIRVANDYTAGSGRDVPSSYNSEDGVFAAGFNINDCSKIEFKAVRLYQHDVEFPGLFFDINRLDTEAYTIRYSMSDPNSLHKINLDLWYNFTGANGDTHQGAKQAFVNNLIGTNFTINPMMPAVVHDFSNTNFSEQSRGYRLSWGCGDQGTPQLGVGTDMNIVSQRLEEHIQFLPGFDTTGIGTPDPFLRQNLGIPVSREYDFGFFVDGALPVGDRLVFHAGARADYVRASSDPRLITGNIILTPGSSPIVGVPPIPDQTSFDPIAFSVDPNDPNLIRHFTLWSAYINGEYKIDDHLSATMGFGHAERPPSLTELYSTGEFVSVLQQGLNRLIGDPHLKAERVNQFDVGFKVRCQHFRAGVNGFYAWIDDYITFDQNKGTSTISQVVYTNTSLATLAGGEAYVEFDAGPWVTPFGTVSYVQGKDLTHIDTRRDPNLASSRRVFDTEPLPGIPPLEFRTGLRVHEPVRQPRWAVELTARSVLNQAEVAATLDELPTPGFTIFDLRGYWKVSDNLLLIAGIENFGDKQYREHLDPRSGPGNPPDPILLRPGANYYLTVQVSY
jgi:outer membrane receptor protein involved in Fe transport